MSSATIKDQDQTDKLLTQVRTAYENRQALAVQGNGSKLFLIHPVSGQPLSTASHQGIINYFPSELTITVRSGTLLSDLKQVLADKGQMLPFEPPAFSKKATIGGTIATGLSGSSRPFAGAARDFVLGCKIINGRGELLQFGGEVIKNVAGYDLSRLVAGSYGSLGIILEVSLKLLPLAVKQQSIRFSLEPEKFSLQVNELLMTGYPITAACYFEGQAYIRLSGSEEGIDFAYQNIIKQYAQIQPIENSFWSELNEQQLSFFDHSQPLWRISLPRINQYGRADEFASSVMAEEKQLIDWGGALHWLYSKQSADIIRQYAQAQGGHAQLFRINDTANDNLNGIPKHQPLTPAVLKLHQRLKSAMDPHSILNPGCIYPDL